MIIKIPSYKHISESQEIDLTNNKICTLIGENGSGKSTILESIFSNYINEENKLKEESDDFVNLKSHRAIAFSSGQNELFSTIFNDDNKNAKRYKMESDQTINSFYFDYWWSKLLIFFATSLKKDGLVRKYLKDKYYIQEDNNFDITSEIGFNIRIGKPLIDRISKELLKEQKGEYVDKPFYRSLYIQYLEKLICYTLSEDYDFTDSDSLRRIVSQYVFFKSKDVNEILGNNINEIFTFISRASTSSLSNFDLKDIRLCFKKDENDIELEDLSDGEYKLLAIYAIIDLFDAKNTIFLFDDVDTHLHYKNLNKLWDILKNINGKVITTTHISESILKNNFETISYVNNGKIEKSLTAREIFESISSR